MGARVKGRLGAPQGDQGPVELERRGGVARLRVHREALRIRVDGQPRLAVAESRGAAGLRRGCPRHGRPLGVAAVHVDDPLGRDVRIGQPELLPLVEKRGAAQRDHEHRGDPCALEPVARGGARVVVVVETPGRPAGLARQILELVDGRTEGARRPGQV
jgi:hypothetical protein